MLNNKNAIVTGATSGIGLAIVKRFVDQGARVLAVGRNQSALQQLEQHERITAHQADLTEADAPARTVEAALQALGGLDVLVNAAGIINSGPLEAISDQAWDALMTINLHVPFRLLRHAIPQLARSKGSVVNVSSVAGLRVFPNLTAYCVSKAALDQLTRAAAIELAPQGIRVNAVNPGVVVTNLHRRSGMSESDYAAFLEHSKQTHPIGRAGEAEEVADLVLFLASYRAGWITGETVAIDGGRHLTCAR